MLQHVGQLGVVEENHVMDSILDDKKEQPKRSLKNNPKVLDGWRDHMEWQIGSGNYESQATALKSET